MKQLFAIIVVSLLISHHCVHSQEIPEGAIKIDENTLIKDELGNKVELPKLMELMNSGEWFMDPVKDPDGKLLYLQLRKATEQEKEMIKNMPMEASASKLIGKKAPVFEMTDIDGSPISSIRSKGKVVVLNFWFAACKPCIAEIPELNEVYERYEADTNVVFASITFEDKKKVKEFLEIHSLNYPVVSDAREICNLFNVSGYPTNIVIDKNGVYYHHMGGGFPDIGSHIANAIQGALEGKKPMHQAVPSQSKVVSETE